MRRRFRGHREFARPQITRSKQLARRAARRIGIQRRAPPWFRCLGLRNSATPTSAQPGHGRCNGSLVSARLAQGMTDCHESGPCCLELG